MTLEFSLTYESVLQAALIKKLGDILRAIFISELP
jgi:hypothetical protein